MLGCASNAPELLAVLATPLSHRPAVHLRTRLFGAAARGVCAAGQPEPQVQDHAVPSVCRHWKARAY